MTRQERHFEPSMCRVLGANKKPKAESADGESPSRGIIATPMADEPSDYEGDQPDATNPHKVMPHRHFPDFARARVARAQTWVRKKIISPPLRDRIVGGFLVQRVSVRGARLH